MLKCDFVNGSDTVRGGLAANVVSSLVGKKALCSLILSMLLAAISIVCVPIDCSALDLPPVVDEYRLLSEKWQVREPVGADGRYSLEVSHKGNLYSWPIEPGFIAQSVGGNSVADEDVAAIAQRYLADMQHTRGGYCMFKVASLTADGPLFVRSFKAFDAKEAYERAAKLGSPILNIESPDVRALGFEKYTQQVTRTTDEDWKRVEKRRR